MTMVRPILEYGCTVWQTAAQTEMKKLEAIQRKALALCLSLPSTAALDALEVAAGIPPHLIWDTVRLPSETSPKYLQKSQHIL